MTDMEHCRFENSSIALVECIEALDRNNVRPESNREAAAARRLRQLCESYIEAYDSSEDWELSELSKV